MLTSRRDYLMRIIDEVTQLVASVVFKRRAGADQDALETVVRGFERLFQLDGDQIFLLTPEQHYEMLATGDEPEFARDKILLYAALSAEAGALYERRGNHALARATRLNALRFTLRARRKFGAADLPACAPRVKELVATLGSEPFDAEIAQLLNAPQSPPPASRDPAAKRDQSAGRENHEPGASR